MISKTLPIMALLAIVSLVAVACGSDPEVVTTTTKSPPPPERPATPVPVGQDNGSGSNSGDGTPVTVGLQDIGGSGKYKFVESELSFKAGETVSFTFKSETEFHTFTVDDLDIDVSVDSGVDETLTFTFDSPGTYKLICVPHESQGMVGTITVQ
ncbi:MAG: plastocyanin/azurin family copper-binding protein [Chloroflexi bacterium]|nr:plastocyanin/azurin family copper-binding protein [Chloroflexota bacterium]